MIADAYGIQNIAFIAFIVRKESLRTCFKIYIQMKM